MVGHFRFAVFTVFPQHLLQCYVDPASGRPWFRHQK